MLTTEQVKDVRTILCNDRVSTDKELHEYFITNIKLTPEQVNAYISNRTYYLLSPELEFTEIILPNNQTENNGH